MSTPFRNRRRSAVAAMSRRAGRVPFLGRLSVPTRMLAVLVIPLIAAVVLAGLRVSDASAQGDQYDRLHRIAQLSQSGSSLINNLQQERDLLIDPQAQAANGNGALQNQEERTSGAAEAFLAAARKIPSSTRLDQHIQAIQAAVGTLPGLRQQGGKISAAQLNSAYLRVLLPIIGINNELGGDLDQSYSPGWATYTLALDTAMTWSERALISDTAKSGNLTNEQRAALLSSARLQDMAQQEFRLNAMQGDVAAYDQLVNGSNVAAANEAMKALGEANSAKLANNTLPNDWYQAFTTKINGLNQLQTTVGQRLVNDFAQSRQQAQDQARNDLLVAALILATALLLAFFVSRSILRGLRELESSAVDVAETRLPAAMKALTSGRGNGAELRVASVAVSGDDEFAAVGRAVDQLHREAVRLAAGQARLRENVSAIFRNLSHRNQSLIQRQLGLITDLEREEPDPQQLARLFQLDHLATRMRRNSENLLVLAGAELGSRSAGPMLVHDAVRSAISEVEQYERIAVHGLPETELTGDAVRDVVHLLAELLENAVSFSSPHSDVTVDGQQLPDQRLVLEICDRGIGMSTDQLVQANGLLKDGLSLDVSISEQLGLYVVGTLARRHGIEVVLRNATPGISTLVILPQDLLHTSGRAPAPPVSETGPLSRPGPGATPHAPALEGPARSAGNGPGPVSEGQEAPRPALEPVPQGPAAPPAPPVQPVPPVPPVANNDPATVTLPAVSVPLTGPGGSWAGPTGGAPDAADTRRHHTGPAPAPLPNRTEPETGGDLPQRVPRAHLLPGAVEQAPEGGNPRDPDQIRSRLSGFQSSADRTTEGEPGRG
ncbi:nitrate- and nitrite sensing domain-containing protein [Streptomyces sp. NPDC004667]|uniref:sensor histidine kinase n=1 Tax=Streptomyces sp. NPDC004667 TaxID=3154285 RepID=UPI0033ACE72B